jgi:hypothetical protein
MVSFLFKFQKEDTQLHHLNAVKKQKTKKTGRPKVLFDTRNSNKKAYAKHLQNSKEHYS